MLRTFWEISARKIIQFLYPETGPRIGQIFWMNNKTIIEFGFLMIEKLCRLGGCYPPRPSASVDNSLLENIILHILLSLVQKLLNILPLRFFLTRVKHSLTKNIPLGTWDVIQKGRYLGFFWKFIFEHVLLR